MQARRRAPGPRRQTRCRTRASPGGALGPRRPWPPCRAAGRRQNRQTDRQAGRRTDRQTDRQIERQTERQTDSQAGRQTDRPTDTGLCTWRAPHASLVAYGAWRPDSRTSQRTSRWYCFSEQFPQSSTCSSLRHIPPAEDNAVSGTKAKKASIIRTKNQARKCDDPMCVVTVSVPFFLSGNWTLFFGASLFLFTIQKDRDISHFLDLSSMKSKYVSPVQRMPCTCCRHYWRYAQLRNWTLGRKHWTLRLHTWR